MSLFWLMACLDAPSFQDGKGSLVCAVAKAVKSRAKPNWNSMSRERFITFPFGKSFEPDNINIRQFLIGRFRLPSLPDVQR